MAATPRNRNRIGDVRGCNRLPVRVVAPGNNRPVIPQREVMSLTACNAYQVHLGRRNRLGRASPMPPSHQPLSGESNTIGKSRCQCDNVAEVWWKIGHGGARPCEEAAIRAESQAVLIRGSHLNNVCEWRWNVSLPAGVLAPCRQRGPANAQQYGDSRCSSVCTSHDYSIKPCISQAHVRNRQRCCARTGYTTAIC